jgi:hypothetical protein
MAAWKCDISIVQGAISSLSTRCAFSRPVNVSFPSRENYSSWGTVTSFLGSGGLKIYFMPSREIQSSWGTMFLRANYSAYGALERCKWWDAKRTVHGYLGEAERINFQRTERPNDLFSVFWTARNATWARSRNRYYKGSKGFAKSFSASFPAEKQLGRVRENDASRGRELISWLLAPTNCRLGEVEKLY